MSCCVCSALLKQAEGPPARVRWADGDGPLQAANCEILSIEVSTAAIDAAGDAAADGDGRQLLPTHELRLL